MRRGWPALAIMLALVAFLHPARAQPTRPLRLQVPPVDLTTPPDNDPQRLANGPDRAAPDCAPQWPCRLRLFGVIQRNGGVGLKGTALNW